ncbi:hypothetical protein [Aquipseudomonas alcaligenes]|uniref:hypothetical protein n=1 Tax=Aquipseudomonas alcaligenes TaxID=43263 RepID=UPI0016592B2A|nr:hypothetical protein [Pseudomonas alcaligenes]
MSYIIINCVEDTPAALDKLLAKASETSGDEPQECYILTTKANFIDDFKSDDYAHIRDRLFTRVKVESISIVLYCPASKSYQLHSATQNDIALANDNFDIAAIAQHDLQKLLDKYSNESFVRSGNEFHFVTPSHNHTNAFFRLGDSIRDRDELDRIAFWTLKEIDQSDFLLIDSWTIAAIPLRALQILSKATKFDVLPAHPAKSPFECIAILCSAAPELKSSNKTTLLVSVASSGSLIGNIKEMFSKDHPDKELNVVSIYSFDAKIPSMCMVEAEIVNYKYEECKFCEAGSTAIEIHPSSYYAKNISDSGVNLSKGIAESGREFFDQYNEHLEQVVSFHRGDKDKGNRHFAYYIDYSVLSAVATFRKKLEAKVASVMPAGSLIISLADDPAIREVAAEQGINFLHLDSVDGIKDSGVRDLARASGKVMIYDTVVIRGSRLESLNNRIRETPGLCGVIKELYFLVGIFRPSDVRAEKSLRNSLAYKDQCAHREFSFIEQVVLPDSSSACPWCQEYQAINRSIKKGFRAKGEFHDRVALLADNVSGISGADALFHIDASTRELALGDGSFLAPPNTCISGVVLAVASGLQRMRSAETEKERLSPGFPYAQVLSSANFKLYSEGVIRAALIRNCSTFEFGVLEKEISLDILQNSLADDGQKCMLSEYIIAVICGKFPQSAPFLDEVNQQLAQLAHDSPELMKLVTR